MRFVKILLTLSLFFIFACQKQTARNKPLLLASIHPYELLLTQLVGSDFEVKSIIPANASPHTWSSSPSNLKDIVDASLILSNGLGLETNLQKSFATRADAHVEAAQLIEESIPKIEFEHQHTHGTELDHKEQDPHLWTSPHLMIRLVTALEKELCKRFPNSALVFSNNAKKIRQELEDLSNKINTERNTFIEPGIITYHNGFGYFTNEFAIEYLGWVQFSPGKEPSPQDLAHLGETIQAHKVKAVFVEPQMNKKAGEVLAKEFNLKLLTLDPLGSSGEAKTISELISDNWDSMKGAFTAK
ncbi:MAG: metal ABC transporter substrate-binding protein [Candidatus Cloacimonetes bacterium]|nr:metal ABC transporter substrate-binding protein [Candidatus Cloacimonadota bacterium]